MTAVDPVLIEEGETFTYTDIHGEEQTVGPEEVKPEMVGMPEGGDSGDKGKGKGKGKGRRSQERTDRAIAKELQKEEGGKGSDGKGDGKGKGKGGGKGRSWRSNSFRKPWRRGEKPIVMEDPVWGKWEFKPGTEPGPYDVVCWSTCPCCVHGYICVPCCGCSKCKRPGMTAQKWKGWRQFLCSFGFLFSVVQTVLLVISIWVMGDGIDPSSGWLCGPTAEPLIDLGAKFTYRILERDEWYRLVMPIFLHGGWVHLVMNLSMQLRIGINLEVEWGHAAWLAIYMGSGLYSFLLSALMLPKHISVGCSGALMGLMGAWFVWAWITWNPKRELINRVVEILVLMTSILVVICQSWMPRVDYACHAGGLLAGVFLAMAIFSFQLKEKRKKITTLISGIVLCILLFWGTWFPFKFMDVDDYEIRFAS